MDSLEKILERGRSENRTVHWQIIDGQVREITTEVEYATYSSDPDDYLEDIRNLEDDDFYGTYMWGCDESSEESDLDIDLDQPLYATRPVRPGFYGIDY